MSNISNNHVTRIRIQVTDEDSNTGDEDSNKHVMRIRIQYVTRIQIQHVTMIRILHVNKIDFVQRRTTVNENGRAE